jgi:hypothetical protein
VKPAALLLALAAAATADDMSLQFANGDELQGRLAGISDATVSWTSDALAGVQPFALNRVVSLLDPTASSPDLPGGDHLATVTLTNGDELRGSLLNIDDSEVVLRTTYAGTLTFRRDMVDELAIADLPELIYEGPRGLDEWTTDDDWSFEKGTLVSKGRGQITRQVGHHDRIRLAFDISWTEATQFRVQLHTAEEDRNPNGSGFELVCQNQYAYLRKRGGDRGRTTNIGTIGGIGELEREGIVRLEILQDLTSGIVRFRVADRTLADWRDNDPNPEAMGSFLRFTNPSSEELRISRIRLTTWDGILEGGFTADADPFDFRIDSEPPPDPQPEPGDQGGIALRNGDMVGGEMLGIRDGQVRLKTPFKEFSLPVSRLRDFPLRTEAEAADPELRWEPIRRNGDVRAWFADGGRVTFRLDTFANGKLTGTSQTFGEASFDLAAFQRIDFNLYRSVLDAAPAP